MSGFTEATKTEYELLLQHHNDVLKYLINDMLKVRADNGFKRVQSEHEIWTRIKQQTAERNAVQHQLNILNSTRAVDEDLLAISALWRTRLHGQI